MFKLGTLVITAGLLFMLLFAQWYILGLMPIFAGVGLMLSDDI